MFKILSLFVFLSLGQDLADYQDVKVVTYSNGKFDTDSYESLSFWIKGNKRAYIQYTRGKSTADMDLRYLGMDSTGGERSFKAERPDHSVFLMTPKGYIIKVSCPKDNYLKYFAWENESQADSTAAPIPCSICAKDEKDAMGMMNKYFLH